VQNGIGFLEVQDGLLDTAGKIVMRMSELKGFASQDPMKGETDIESYNNEFRDLQLQLFAISNQDFNGMSLFANHISNGQGGDTGVRATFNGTKEQDHTLDIYTSTKGSAGTTVSIHKSLLLSAITLTMASANGVGAVTNGGQYNTAANGTGLRAASHTIALASETQATAMDLSDVSAGVFEKAIENVVFLRAQTGGGMSRLGFAAESMKMQETNMRSALGRIEDVDIAEESANLAKYSILMQASAAMVAQANSTSQVALMLLQG
jgi:flagellin